MKMPPKILTTASAAVPTSFMGREQELSDIRKLLTRQNTLALVNAEGGMGKTTLAAKYWQEYEAEYQHLAWLFCEKGILSSMRDHLPHNLGLIEELNQFADQPEKQVQVIKNALANLPKDCLLVLDNANEEDHIRAFQQEMAGLGWHVLITSRCSKVLTDTDSEYKIKGLPPEQAKAFFKKHHDEETPEFEALLDRFLPAVDYNTLCIEVFSKNLREGIDWGLSFAQLLEKLEKNGFFLGKESFEIRTHWANNVQKETVKSTDQVIAALFDVADLQQRHPELHDLLSTFALLPTENYPPNVLAPLLAPEDKLGLKRQLDQLSQKGWLSSDRSSYRISPVLQKILLKRNAERLWTLGEPLAVRLEAIFENEGYHPKNIAIAGAFAELVPGFIDNLNTGEESLAWLFNRLWFYHNAVGNLAKALEVAEKMEVFCRSYEFKQALATAFNKLGETHRALGNLPQALTFFEQCNGLEKELHEAYPQNVEFKNGLAISYSKLGETHRALDNLPQALTFFEQCNGLEKELHEAYPQNVELKNGLAISYQNLGETLSELDDLPQALTFYEQYHQLEKELHETYPQNVNFKNLLAVSYSKLGETHSALGDLPQALTFYEKDIEISKEIHEAFPQNVEFKKNLATSYLMLAHFYRTQNNDKEMAKPYLQKGYELYVELVRDFPEQAGFKGNYNWAKNALED